MLRARLPLIAAGVVLVVTLAAPGAPARAQGESTATLAPGDVPFRCPGLTDVSAVAETSAFAEPATPTSVAPVSPVDAAESPCVVAGSEPDVEWSADHNALRMTSHGTWRAKMRVVLQDFDALHGEYVADPLISDTEVWSARLEETLQLAQLFAHQSHQDVVVYYASALRDEYKAGIFGERPLLTTYGRQARAKLDELTSSPPAPTPHRGSRR